MAQNRYKIRAYGALSLVLYVSRALCAAPLVFEKRGIRISHLLFVVGRVVFTFISAFVIFDGYYEIVYISPEKTIFSRTFYVLVEGGILMINMIAVYTAERRMHLYIQKFECLKQMNKMIHDSNVGKNRRTIDVFIKFYVVICLIITIVSYSFYLQIGYWSYDGLNVFRHIIESIVHCSERIQLTALTIQFALLTLQVYHALENVNFQLSRDIQRHSKCEGGLKVSNIRQYAFHHISLCTIVRQVVKNDENMIIIILVIFFLYLGWIIQTCFSEIYKYSFQHFASTTMYFMITGLTYLIYLIIIIEPCHRVHEEMETLNLLVCKSMQCPSLSLQVTNELEAFKLLLEMNKPTYSPLRLCTLARPLFLKIVGALISYSVFVLQLSENFF